MLGIQHFCDMEFIDPAILNEMVWFENPSKIVDDIPVRYEKMMEREQQLMYLAELFNSSKFIWYE